ncbi:hypothetical protein [Halorubrum sp. SP9]|uniref:hypothetical protein n=1 Tax=Halorubrum sp. SP9 TaxID=1537267 RepID=UPI0010F8331E|nr:hypothetical protein [Halorubrum sp. SP9]TKX68220.1 hypothetical protein EXE45_12120 [Halorubrum sp. SP9]
MEDNATASLLKVVSEVSKPNRNPELAKSILETLSGREIEGFGEGRITCDVQQTVGEIPTQNREIHLIGLSPSNKELTDINLDTDSPSGGRVDGVVEVDDNLTLVLEVKTQGDNLNRSQLQGYANSLGITPTEYNTATWAEVANTVSNLTNQNSHPVTGFLLDELYEFIRLTTLNYTLTTAHWEENGEYRYSPITLRYGESMNRRTEVADADPEPPQIQIEFGAGHHNSIAFSRSEWQEVINQFPDRISRAFAEGNYEPFLDLMREEGRTVLAKVGDPNGVRKTIEANPDKDRITFQSRTSKTNSHYRGRPTIHQTDFENLYSPSKTPDFGETPYLTPGGEIARALFIEGDISAASPVDL